MDKNEKSLNDITYALSMLEQSPDTLYVLIAAPFGSQVCIQGCRCQNQAQIDWTRRQFKSFMADVEKAEKHVQKKEGTDTDES